MLCFFGKLKTVGACWIGWVGWGWLGLGVVFFFFSVDDFSAPPCRSVSNPIYI